MKLLHFLCAIIVVAMFTSCQTDEGSLSDISEVDALALELNTENERYPLINSETVFTKSFFGAETEFHTVENFYVLGDMLLTKKQVEESNNIAKGVIENLSSRLWPQRGDFHEVHYVVDPSLPRKERVYDAIRHWEQRTSIRFIPRTNQRDYVKFEQRNGCFSIVGKLEAGGEQIISVGSGCSTGNTIHEIGHAIGLFHEQGHPQRDNFVNVLEENVFPQGRVGNFRKLNANSVETTSFDFGSIMMYGSFFFSNPNDRKPTITKKDGSTFNVQRNGLSPKDIEVVDFMYPNKFDTNAITDINGNWAYNEIAHFISNGKLRGYPNRTFRPNNSITRAELAAMIVATIPLSSSNNAPTLSDISGHWAENAIKQVARAGFMSGYPDGTFRPNRNVTRQEVIVALTNGVGSNSNNVNELNFFSDVNSIANWAKPAILRAFKNKLIVNYANKRRLNPTRNATRAEVAAILYRRLVWSRNIAHPYTSPYLAQ
ncbi:M12 family metallopeptidase [uncultured Aquimarina sp.]|uniref:M12 family metallopeptidase n=1 Tax=uncultured Aquimarina sp. TaxID=575652 RepID=UPI00260F6EE6|nr:M12 family metallopeptidase [uncultured Aquimarina sp.]